MGVQASLPPDLVPLGATTLLFVISASCAIFLAVGQAVFQERLAVGLIQVVSPEVVKEILSVGATGIRSIIDAEDLPAVIEAYSKATTQVFVSFASQSMASYLLVNGTAELTFPSVSSRGGTRVVLHLYLWDQMDFNKEAKGDN